MIDLRSDTVTRPTAGMRQAIAEAQVGDDVFGEDPTVIALQDRLAELLGKEAALFVPSGTMSNQLALRVQTDPGDEVICEAGCHVINYESGAPGVLSGVQLRAVPGTRGALTADLIEAAIRSGYYWEPKPRMVCLENTHNKAGGTIHPQEDVVAIGQLAGERGLAFHLDGARIWNASVASGLTERELAEPFDTVSVCLSKGLGAPVGSALLGTRELIDKAHRWRKLLGGGMRQVGLLAAAGLYALDHHRADLKQDHARARRLAEGLAGLPGVRVDPAGVETNIVMFDIQRRTALEALDRLNQEGVLMVPFGPATIRATTHRDLSDDDITLTLEAARRVFV